MKVWNVIHKRLIHEFFSKLPAVPPLVLTEICVYYHLIGIKCIQESELSFRLLIIQSYILPSINIQIPDVEVPGNAVPYELFKNASCDDEPYRALSSFHSSEILPFIPNPADFIESMQHSIETIDIQIRDSYITIENPNGYQVLLSMLIYQEVNEMGK